MSRKNLFLVLFVFITVSIFAAEKDFVLVKGNNKVSDFYICNHEVTQAEYGDIMEEAPSQNEGDNNPVEMVSWFDAVNYCNKLSQAKGLTLCYQIDKIYGESGEEDDYELSVKCNFAANGYRLPTETEWEYAAKGGNKQDKSQYSGSNNIADVAWYVETSDFTTKSVKKLKPNKLGIYDMSGNVWEWCNDWYGEQFPSSGKDYTGPEVGESRVVRGGAHVNDAEFCTVSFRNKYNPNTMYASIGFRVVRSAKK